MPLELVQNKVDKSSYSAPPREAGWDVVYCWVPTLPPVPHSPALGNALCPPFLAWECPLPCLTSSTTNFALLAWEAGASSGCVCITLNSGMKVIDGTFGPAQCTCTSQNALQDYAESFSWSKPVIPFPVHKSRTVLRILESPFPRASLWPLPPWDYGPSQMPGTLQSYLVQYQEPEFLSKIEPKTSRYQTKATLSVVFRWYFITIYYALQVLLKVFQSTIKLYPNMINYMTEYRWQREMGVQENTGKS